MGLIMTGKKRVIKRESFIISLVFVPIFCVKALGLGASSKAALFITVVSIVFSILVFLEKHITGKESYIWGCILLLGFVNIFISGKFSVFFSIYTLFLMKNIDSKKLRNALFIVGSLIFFYLIVENYSSGSTEARYISGTWQHIVKRNNIIYVVYFALANLLILKKKECFKLFAIILMEVAGFLLFLYTGTRTGFYCLLLEGIILVFFKCRIIQRSKTIIHITTITPIVFTLISYWMNCMYGSIPVLYSVNSMLQNRLYYGKQYLDMYGISLWGQRIAVSYVEETYQVLDNTYLSLMINYGIILLLLWLWLNVMTLKYLLQEKRYAEVAIIIGYFFYGFTESFVIVCFLNMSFFIYNDFLSQHRRIHDIEKNSVIG